ncbi:MAG: biotin--[acetyl-CoA-carboxylase] ligase [Elusimicrobiota bacterium]
MSPRVLRLKSAPSTQDIARRAAEEGAPAWTVIHAERQTKGRGRLRRRWATGPGALTFSLILRPKLAPSRLGRLSLAAGRAAARAIRRAAKVAVAVKLPNDVMAKPRGERVPYRKVCGILIEASGDTKKIDWAVLGVGVNVNNRLPRRLRHAVSLAELTGKKLNPEAVLKSLIREFRRTFK